ncbi:conserved hypothetical protein [Anaeromyxobacter dehalogenans 2CP-1]|uniref:DoxX family protein n=1 Tax=Anaeromyxobacter dehalogenans (strain ATCC BAA-258 / DSM 21875 / 2CP-1) TaxID=455488 RepID=B8JHE3_ANAD2|nr:DoxX family protein [Anaeromyxobacter dehalogenans]ACL66655.1 conserved hypothetical protein [Anaeromyxobacter dehalogenans 2CP-1]
MELTTDIGGRNTAGAEPVQAGATSRTAVWTGRVLSGLAIAFLALDAMGKLVRAAPVLEGTQQLGFPLDTVVGIGATLLACVALYAVPRTAALGAILLTAYLGGAVATQVRVGNPLFSHVLFPTYVAALIWGGLVLRDRRLRVALLRGRAAREAEEASWGR